MSTKRYESKQQQILRPAADIYSRLDKFSNFTPILEGKVNDWKADDDTCSFSYKFLKLSLRIINREPAKLIKIVPGDGAQPINFTLWTQLKQVDDNDTRIRIVVDLDGGFMINQMGGQIQKAIDGLVEQIAQAFNTTAR